VDLKQGDLENIILNAVWDLETEGHDKIYVGEVQDKIKSAKKKWAYTTVKTVLDRLVDKELATRLKDGKKYLYKAVVQREEAGVIALRKVLRQYFKNDMNALIDSLMIIQREELAKATTTGKTDSEVEKMRDMAMDQLQSVRKQAMAG